MKNLFDKTDLQEVIERIEKITPDKSPLWGKMNAAQMFAHCSVVYEIVYEPQNYPKVSFLSRFLLKLLLKPIILSDRGFPKNGKTSQEFIIADARDFDREKAKLVSYLTKTQELGESFYHNKEHRSFGVLTAPQWNKVFYKHLHHHLEQFGV